MKDDVKSFVKEKTRELLEVPYCCDEAKAAAQRWLAAIGTPDEDAETARYARELAEDVVPVDEFVAFAGSAAAAEHFGKEAAAGLLAHANELKASGAKYCDCDACDAAAAIVEKLNG